jgi:hypothetical protein
MAEDFSRLPATATPTRVADRLQRLLADHAGACGPLLAKGHARTSGASMIAGYLGRGEKADAALCRFARHYADQTECDHATLLAAIERGVLPAESGL